MVLKELIFKGNTLKNLLSIRLGSSWCGKYRHYYMSIF